MEIVLRRVTSMVGTLLILVGLVIPTIPAVAKESTPYADWSIADPLEAAPLPVAALDATCSPSGYRRSLPDDSTLALPMECPNLHRLAPGDEGLAGTYHITYIGPGSTPIFFSSQVEGQLFKGTHPVELTITDQKGKTYSHKGANQPVATLRTGESVTLTVTYRWAREAGDPYQGNQGSIQMKIRSGKGAPDPGPDPKPDPDPKPRPDPNPEPDPTPGPDPQPNPTPPPPPGPAPEPSPDPDPQTPPLVTTGRVVVSVLGDPLLDGTLVPIPNATVTLGDLTGTTGPDGLAIFDGLRFGSYSANATGINPLTGTEPKTGLGRTRISAEEPEGQITIILTWSPPAAGPPPPPESKPLPEPPPPPGDQLPGAIQGRICAPREPGTRILATNDTGQVVTIAIAATGRLGTWVAYELLDLPAGQWQLSLQNPEGDPITQEVRVEPGQRTKALDFSLACTGESATPLPARTYYLVAALLVTGGLYLRRFGRFTRGVGAS